LLKVNWEILKLGDFEISQFQNFPIDFEQVSH